ncbi:hypothetical protein BU15DRAFT_82595 [Melanogaster broomeanus]|nr:hypothetical protein BU15DRAFT_82593 [Melanogaster broomeanus]KAF9231284.1 hypothetical protein BU15DRAFT_82595 [Melanogaster broomeanus]
MTGQVKKGTPVTATLAMQTWRDNDTSMTHRASAWVQDLVIFLALPLAAEAFVDFPGVRRAAALAIDDDDGCNKEDDDEAENQKL